MGHRPWQPSSKHLGQAFAVLNDLRVEAGLLEECCDSLGADAKLLTHRELDIGQALEDAALKPQLGREGLWIEANLALIILLQDGLSDRNDLPAHLKEAPAPFREHQFQLCQLLLTHLIEWLAGHEDYHRCDATRGEDPISGTASLTLPGFRATLGAPGPSHLGRGHHILFSQAKYIKFYKTICGAHGRFMLSRVLGTARKCMGVACLFAPSPVPPVPPVFPPAPAPCLPGCLVSPRKP